MGVNTLSAPLLGHLYDRFGFLILIIVTIFSALFAPLVFFGHFELILVGVALWSIGVSAHESLMRAIVANMILSDKRGSAYGLFNMRFGIFWFLGSFLMGVIYDISILSVVIFSVLIQLLAVPFMFVVIKKLGSIRNGLLIK